MNRKSTEEVKISNMTHAGKRQAEGDEKKDEKIPVKEKSAMEPVGETKIESGEESTEETVEEAKIESGEESTEETVEEAKIESGEESAEETVEEAKIESGEESTEETVEEAKIESGEESAEKTVGKVKVESGEKSAEKTGGKVKVESEEESTKETVGEAKIELGKESAEKAVGEAKIELEEESMLDLSKESAEKLKQGSLGGDLQAENHAQEKEPEQLAKKKGSGKKVVLALLAVALLLAVGYFGTVVYYRSHFFPNTSINGISCGNMKVIEVVPLIDAQLEDYSLKVTGRDYRTGEQGALLGEIRAEDVSLAYEDTAGAVAEVFAQQNAFLWPQAYLGKRQFAYSLVQGVRFDGKLLRDAVNKWDACRKENMIEPTDAYISEYREETNRYDIVPETKGTTLVLDSVYQCLESCLYGNGIVLDLEEMGCYVSPDRDRTDQKLAESVEIANKWLETKVVYDWNDNEVVLDSALLKDWVRMEQEEPVLDENAIRDFVKEQAKKYDTYGKRKNFVTALGITLKLRSPSYGWKTNVDTETAELIQLIRQGSQEEREPIYSIKASQKGANDIGSSYVEADLTHQHLYVYQNGEVVLETDFVSGKMNPPPGNMTPAGIYGLTYKTTNAVLRGADYESPVDYWMPFYGNYGMHDAQWRRDFGGTIYLDHGSHGCINLPLDAAAAIYNYVYTSSPIICYYYEVDPLGPAEPTTLTEEELRSQEEPTLSQRAEQEQQEPTQ